MYDGNNDRLLGEGRVSSGELCPGQSHGPHELHGVFAASTSLLLPQKHLQGFQRKASWSVYCMDCCLVHFLCDHCVLRVGRP